MLKPAGLLLSFALICAGANADTAAFKTGPVIEGYGAAAMDLVTDERFGGENASAPLVAALVDAGVRIKLCGQTAAYRGIVADDLLPGVGMSVSAMTAHALLQQEGYSLNPF